ncbi:MAG: T9SS type A sorting domain-containing protein [Ignavibacteria bacterium]|nr:T9SS type A sorting domain-containing protein [Ignavibacteria bacterium]
MGQKYPDDAMIKERIDTKSPYIPLELGRNVNTTAVYYNSPAGIFMVGPSYRIWTHSATQSEIEGYFNPNVPNKIMVGWNSYGPSFYGTGFGLTTNTGLNWTGNYTLPGLAANSGDPSVVISTDGKIYMNAIGSSSSTQVVTWSTNDGVTWAPYVIASSISSSVADKNHMTIDDKAGSPYLNSLYLAYTDFSSSSRPLKYVRSTNAGVNWINTQLISSTLGWAFQGVNLHTGPNGEVYMVWATRMTASPYTEKFVGFAKSTNGGANFQLVNETAVQVNGIRGNLKTSNVRVNSFPWMAVDKTGGPNNGNIYVTWTQKQLAPAGNDPDICMVRSTNGGVNWNAPIRINDDPINNGKDQWFSNICVDSYGGVNIVFYDSRNAPNNDSTEVFVARSIDGGVTFTNINVSGHKFYPKPISGLAGGYFGDYIGIAANNNTVYPFWMDDYSGTYQCWTSPIEIGPAINHTPLTNTEQISGTRQVLCTITPAGSGINPSKTKLYYSKNTTTFTDSLQMANTGGTNWYANITLTGAGLYRYYIKTTDSLNRTATNPGGAPANYHSFTASTDTVKPVITHTPLTNVPKLQWPATINAIVTDNIGVDSVWVKWQKNNYPVIKRFNLANTSGNEWSAAFNSDTIEVIPGDSIFYRIIARDKSAAHNMDSTLLYSFVITNQAIITIGTGTTAIGWPFYTYYMDSRTDMLYLSNEINIPSGGYITQIGFDVVSVSSQVMNGFCVFMQNTTSSSISGFTTSGWTNVYTGIYTVPGTGWQLFTLQTPFYYEGGKNLLIDICFNNSNYTTNSTVNGSAATNRNKHQHSDLSSGNGCVDIITPGSTYTTLPNIRIVMYPGTTKITQPENEIPVNYQLKQNYPNPFNPVTKINFAIPKQEFVSLKVYDVLGRVVANLVSEEKPAGNYIVDFDASYLASGVYFYKMEVNGFTDVKSMMLIK